MFERLLTKWRGFLLQKLDIREGEFRRVWLMQLNIFLLIQCLWIIKPVVNAEFLSRVGIQKLPTAFLLVALTALIVSLAYSRLLRRVPLGKIMMRTYLISIFSLLWIAFLMHFNLFKDWMSYLFYIGVALFGLITTSQFWLLGNLVFSSLEAKRLFGFIGAGAIAGGISGGYVTSAVAPLMDSETLLFAAAGLLMISMWVTQKIWMAFVPASDRSIQISKSFQEYPFRLIRNSKHLSLLALIMGISVIVDKLVEFQFSSIASSRILDPQQLTAFFGFWFSTSNVVSLFIQLFITQRLIAFLGVGRSLLVFPGALFAGAAMVLNTPVLWAGTTLKLIDISLKQSINKAATELLILPIPMAIKSQVKTFIDVFVDTTATGIGGIILIFIVNGLHLSVRAVCVMILALIGLWFYFAFRVRREYVRTFQEKLGINDKSQKRKDLLLWDTNVGIGIRRTLHSGTAKQIIFLLERIEESKDARLMPDTIPLLGHNSPIVRQAALRCLYYSTDHTIISHVEPLLKDPDEDVRSRAFSCLLAHTRQDRVRFIDHYLTHEDSAISGAALVGLATEARNNPLLQKQFNLESRILEKINLTDQFQNNVNIQADKIMLMRAIGYGKVKAYYPLLMTYMKDKDPLVVKQALLAAGSSQDPFFVKTLLTFLTQKSTRSAAQKAIAKYDPSEILPILINTSLEKNVSTDILIRLPALAKTMDTQQAIDYLFGFLRHHNTTLRTEALKVLHIMNAKFPHLVISGKRITSILQEEASLYKDTLALRLAAQQIRERVVDDPNINSGRKELIRLLERKLESILEQIFLTLGLIYPPGLMWQLLKELHSQDQNTRVNAVELLDNILKPAQKHIVLPILETKALGSVSHEILTRLELHIPSEFSCYESILKNDDEQNQMIVLTMIKNLDQADIESLLNIAARDGNPRVRAYAEELIAKRSLV